MDFLPATPGARPLPPLLVTCHSDRAVRGHAAPVTAVSLAPVAGQVLFASCGLDGRIKFWDLRSPTVPLYTVHRPTLSQLRDEDPRDGDGPRGRVPSSLVALAAASARSVRRH
eukprot:gnl/Ergobibamus_cyprinoides/4638.p1 GENE.gnl/Ergobibamus_cyprinoides/4638~~gnl/Ergobibamus_cyprinoides/4638.p1  ORF type:complete len:131 (+),score=17.85 gnl/Ergobibamus_cyprinoides/4638:55-393(+)